MTLAGLAALTVPAVVDCLATLGITMTSFPERGYALSDQPISWSGYDRFFDDDFFQGLEDRRRNEGILGSVVYDERGRPFPISGGLPDRVRSIFGPTTVWPHLVAMRDPQTEASVEWVPSRDDVINSARGVLEGSAHVAWHHAVFFSAWLGWKVQNQTGARVYFRLPTWAERGYPLRQRLGLSENDQLVESFGDRAPDRRDVGPALDRWPLLDYEWLIDGRNPSGPELMRGYRLLFSASEFISGGTHSIDAVGSQIQTWENFGVFRVAVEAPLPPLVMIP